jgi:hypothetical protein
VAIAEKKNQSTFDDPVCAQLSRLLNYTRLGSLEILEQPDALIKEG